MCLGNKPALTNFHNAKDCPFHDFSEVTDKWLSETTSVITNWHREFPYPCFNLKTLCASPSITTLMLYQWSYPSRLFVLNFFCKIRLSDLLFWLHKTLNRTLIAKTITFCSSLIHVTRSTFLDVSRWFNQSKPELSSQGLTYRPSFKPSYLKWIF